MKRFGKIVLPLSFFITLAALVIFGAKKFDFLQDIISMNSFYVTLPSNTKITSNKTGDFIVRLPEKLNLTGKWEVALVELTYPNSWNNIGIEDEAEETTITIMIQYKDKYIPFETLFFNIPAGHYSDIETLCASINDSFNEFTMKLKENEKKERGKMKEKLKGLINRPDDDPSKIYINDWWKRPERKSYLQLQNAFILKFDKIRHKVIASLNTSSISAISFPKKLFYILGGFPSRSFNIFKNETIADHPPDLSGGIDTMFIYCDLVQSQIVGDVRAQLLRTVKIEGKYGDTVNKVFYTPHYLPLLKTEFDTIQINVKTDTNTTVPFQYGKIIAQLHFRKVNVFGV